MKLFELLQLLNTEINGIPAPGPQSVQPAPAQITQPQQPAPAQITQPQQPVSVAVAEQMEGPMEYNGVEQLLQQILASQQSSANAVSQLTSTLQAAQVGMGIQTQPAEDRANMATARIINPMFGKDVK